MALFLRGRRFKRAFNAFLDPLSLVWVLNVHVFDTDRTNIGIVQAGKQIAKQHLLASTEATRGE